MMTVNDLAEWMQHQLDQDGCLYQEDVVDYLVKGKEENFLRENSDGNQVLTPSVLTAFRKLNADTVVWVKPGRYWRYRVREDEPGRDARG